MPFFLSEKCPFFLGKKCLFKVIVKHTPFLLRKMAFSSIFKSLNANFCPWRGTHSYYREGTRWAKGHLYASMGHLSCYIWALMAKTEPGNCPREPFSLPLHEGAQSRAVKAHFFVEEKGIFLNFKSLNAHFCPWRGTVKCKGAPLYLNGMGGNPGGTGGGGRVPPPPPRFWRWGTQYQMSPPPTFLW